MIQEQRRYSRAEMAQIVQASDIEFSKALRDQHILELEGSDLSSYLSLYSPSDRVSTSSAGGTIVEYTGLHLHLFNLVWAT
jgi:hypothetical protein